MARVSYLSKGCSVLIALAVGQNGGTVMAHPRTLSGYERAPLSDAAGTTGMAPLAALPGGPNAGALAGRSTDDKARPSAEGPVEAVATSPDVNAPEEAPEGEPCSTANKRLRHVQGKIDRDVLRTAAEQLDLPMGAGRALSINGRSYLFCLEPHYREPGSGPGPQGWHKGVTVFEGP